MQFLSFILVIVLFCNCYVNPTRGRKSGRAKFEDMTTKFDIEKFSIERLCRIKIKVILIMR